MHEFYRLRIEIIFFQYIDFLKMMLLLLLLFSLFSIVIFLLLKQFNHEQKLFQQKIASLQKIIVESKQKSALQSNQLQLTTELEKTLRANNTTLSHSIFNLNYDLFELLAQNNLLQSKK